MDTETRELIAAFVEEGHELIEDAEAHIEALKEDEPEEQVVNTVFRLFHSLKGSAGYLDFNTIQAVTHEAETLLSLFQQGRATISRSHTELLIEVIDFLRQLIDAVDTHLSDGVLSDDAVPVVRRIQEMISHITDGSDRNETLGSHERSDPCDGSADNDESFRQTVLEQFATETPDNLDLCEQYLEQIVPGGNNRDALIGMQREIHSIKGNAGILGFEDVVKRSGDLETINGRMTEGSVGVTKPTLELLQDELDALRSAVEHAVHVARSQLLSDASEPGNTRNNAPAFDEPAADSHEQGVVLDLPEDGSPPADEQDDRDPSDRDIRSQATAERNGADDPDRPSPTVSSGATTVRVPTDRLDRLFELVGELITAESMVVNSPDLEGLNLQVFRKRSSNLAKLTRELHEVALEVRMIPLQGTFQKMKRLARDVARRVEKPVTLEIEGGETEMDKTVIEKISDPLIHIIRNAIDHGLESPEERVAAGKRETGTVRLSAGYEGREVVITVADDGGGIDRKKLMNRARESGVISDDGSSLNDREVRELIFEPGLSTREAVSDVSGRGVGMDVVRSNLTAVRGRVTVDSEPGKGTAISFHIPITLAIIDTVTVRIANQAYSIDLTDVNEFVRFDAVHLNRTIEGRVAIDLRNRTVPIANLEELLSFHRTTTTNRGKAGMILATNGCEFCVPLDEVIGTQQTVVKSLPDYLGSVAGLAGMSIMPDGNVTYILDVRALARHLFK